MTCQFERVFLFADRSASGKLAILNLDPSLLLVQERDWKACLAYKGTSKGANCSCLKVRHYFLDLIIPKSRAY